jgi:hypothetical protein
MRPVWLTVEKTQLGPFEKKEEGSPGHHAGFGGWRCLARKP